MRREQFTQDILKLCPDVTFEHASGCPKLALCQCAGKASNRDVHGCPSVLCRCDGTFHSIRLKTESQWRAGRRAQ